MKNKIKFQQRQCERCERDKAQIFGANIPNQIWTEGTENKWSKWSIHQDPNKRARLCHWTTESGVVGYKGERKRKRGVKAVQLLRFVEIGYYKIGRDCKDVNWR